MSTLGVGICSAKTNTCEIIDQVGQTVYSAASRLLNLSIALKVSINFLWSVLIFHVNLEATTSVQNQRLNGDAFPFVQLADV